MMRALECAGELNSGERGGMKLLDSNPEGAPFISPGRNSAVPVERSNESRRDGTGSHAHSLAPEGLAVHLWVGFQS